MKPQVIENPYSRIAALEGVVSKIATWARVDIDNKTHKVKRSLPPCLRAEDVVRLVEGVM